MQGSLRSAVLVALATALYITGVHGRYEHHLGRRLLGNQSHMIAKDLSTPATTSDGDMPHEQSHKRAGGINTDAEMIAEMENPNSAFPSEQVMDLEDMNDPAVSFTQFMGTAGLAVSDFFETGYIMANLDGTLTSNIAKILVAIRYGLYVSLCVLVGALVTAVGMVLDRLVIAMVTKRFEITVGKKGTIAFLFIFGVLGILCSGLIAYWLFFQGPVWLPVVLIVALVGVMFALQKSSKGKKWFDEVIECVYLLVAPVLFVSRYGLAAMGKNKIAFPYDV